MKHSILAFLALIVSAIIVSCGPSREDAANFNNMLIAQQKQVVNQYDELVKTYDTYNAEKMDNQLVAFLTQLSKAEEEVKAMPNFDGADQLKKAFLDYIEQNRSVAENEVRELIRIYKIPEEEFTTELHNSWNDTYTKGDNKIKTAESKFMAAQKAFAEKFQLILGNAD